MLPQTALDYINEQSVGAQIYQLPDEDIETTRLYRNFLYTNLIFSILPSDREDVDDGKDAEWTRLAHCYLFGITIRDESFSNASIDAILEKMEDAEWYPTGVASEVYAYTSPGDNLRKLIVDMHVWCGQGTWIDAPHDDANGPVEFLQDVIRGMAKEGSDIYEKDVKMPWETNGCAYHTHLVTAKCNK